MKSITKEIVKGSFFLKITNNIVIEKGLVVTVNQIEILIEVDLRANGDDNDMGQ